MGGKRAKQFFQKQTNRASKKCWEKINAKKCEIVRAKNVKKTPQKLRRNVFYIHTNIVTKKWEEKNRRNNFSRNTPIVRAKNVGKKSMQKSAKKRFL